MAKSYPLFRVQALILRSKVVAVILAFVFSMTMVAHGESYALLHSFTGGPDGAHPTSGLTMDRHSPCDIHIAIRDR
jgi:hypothetical protein